MSKQLYGSLSTLAQSLTGRRFDARFLRAETRERCKTATRGHDRFVPQSCNEFQQRRQFFRLVLRLPVWLQNSFPTESRLLDVERRHARGEQVRVYLGTAVSTTKPLLTVLHATKPIHLGVSCFFIHPRCEVRTCDIDRSLTQQRRAFVVASKQRVGVT